MNASRRKLIAAALAGVLVGSPAAHARMWADSLEYDVVVVGSGLAGLCAAISAHQAGAARVLVLEKAPMVGGNSVQSSGTITAVDPVRQGAQGISDSPAQLLRDCLELGKGGVTNPAVLRVLATKSAGCIDWLESLGIEFEPKFFQSMGGMRYRNLSPKGRQSGRYYVAKLVSAANRLGITIRLNCEVTGFAKTEADPVYSWTLDFLNRGSSQTLRCREIILCTGGFSANVSLRLLYDQRLDDSMVTTANPNGLMLDTATGDGIRMASKLGAKVANMDKFLMIPYWGGRTMDYAGSEIYINTNGLRFTNEEGSLNSIASDILDQPGRTMFVITDALSAKSASIGIKVSAGSIRTASSIGEMAKDMNVDPQALKSTIEQYNSAASGGIKDPFGRRIFNHRLEHMPFYWGREELAIHETLGGLVTDADGAVLDNSDSPIGHLWAAGETVGGIFGSDRLGGMSLTNCVVMGRIAGENAARATLTENFGEQQGN